MTDEKVICIRISEISQLNDYLLGLAEEPRFVLLPRTEAEFSAVYAHLVVYPIVLINGRYLCYQRKSETEFRLDGNIAFFGGHVNVDDIEPSTSLHEVITVALQRELEEELGKKLSDEVLFGASSVSTTSKYIGLIYSNATEVDSVHIGYCELRDVQLPNEDDIKAFPALRLYTHEELTELVLAKKTDNWIRIALELKAKRD